jgi:ribosome biogenesis protein ENP2
MREYEIDVGGDDLTSSGAGALQGGINTGSVNTAAVAEESHGLMAFGTSIGTVEYWDPRSRNRVAVLGVPQDHESAGARSEVTALDFHRSGITTAVGTSTGMIYLYDLRSPLPLLQKDHGYGYPVQTLQFLTPSTKSRIQTDEPKILSADKRIIKLWDERDGAPWTSVEPAVDINCVAWCKDSGMFLTANEGRQQHAFFVPQLGPAPKWCSFLDSIVEEMAEDPDDPNAYSGRQAGEIYDNYKFLTMAQLQTINLDHLVGKTNLLRPYMHGYFVAQRLYEEAQLIANPSSWEEERAKRVKEKLDKERESRIRGKKQISAKVNRKIAEKILEREEKNERRRAQRILAMGGDENPITNGPTEDVDQEEKGLLGDMRFARLFQDEDFTIDETSREFQSLNPSSRPAPSSNHDREKRLTAVEEEMMDDVPGSSSDEDGSDDAQMTTQKDDRISSANYKRRPQLKKGKQKSGQMRVTSSSANKNAKDKSFGSRASNMKPRDRTRAHTGAVGEKVFSFEPQSGRRNKKPKPDHNIPGEYRSAKDRRSASGNTFRRM